MTRVLVWNEGIHEKHNEEVRAVYPDGIHGAINQLLKVDKTIVVRTATLADVEHGLTEAALAQTDVLIWWGAPRASTGRRRGRCARAGQGAARHGFDRPAQRSPVEDLPGADGDHLQPALA